MKLSRRLEAARNARSARGAASVFVVGMAVALLVCAGLVVDGGGALNSRMRLADNVEQAARAGAQEIDEVSLRSSGVVVLDRGAAEARARQYVAALGYASGQVVVTDDAVTVTASDVVPTQMLNLIGIRDFGVSATATADAVTQ